jgi:hypothetical protein
LSLYIDGATGLCCDVALELAREYDDEVLAYAEDSLPHVTSLSSIASSAELIDELRLRGR